jgi:hypothetical protein
MQSGVSSSHEISQKKLNGKPRTMGYTRSQSETEVHTAVKGISARRIDPRDGLLAQNLWLSPYLIRNFPFDFENGSDCIPISIARDIV